MSFTSIRITAITISLLAITSCGSDTENLVKVFKHDQSIQCSGGGVSLDEMRLELAREGVDVICAQKGHDGLARPTVCEIATGNLNIYVINKSNLPDAEKLGFKVVSELSEYRDQKCTN